MLKDIFDYSLEEIADLVDSTVGGVKAALSRGRAKLERLQEAPKAVVPANPETLTLLRAYVDRFNRRDWDGVRELASADARLRVADCFAGRLADSRYFVEYERPIIPWRMALGEVDGEMVVVILRDDADGLTPFSVIRLGVAGDRIVRIADYIKCPMGSRGGGFRLPSAASGAASRRVAVETGCFAYLAAAGGRNDQTRNDHRSSGFDDTQGEG